MLWWLVILSIAWLLLTAALAYVDARRLGVNSGRALRLALPAIARPFRYWYQERLQFLPDKERAHLQAEQAGRLGLQQVDSLRCPLCNTEIPRVWMLDGAGRLAVQRHPVSCPECDFRLDSCRHCAHFKPKSGIRYDADYSQGSCTFYKTVQPVEEFCEPGTAQQLQKHGYSHLSGPTRVTDSYVPLHGCAAFVLDEQRLKATGVRIPGLRQRGLLERAG